VKILVALDRSRMSESVLKPVSRLARPLGAEVQLLTVIRPPTYQTQRPIRVTGAVSPAGTPSGAPLRPGVRSEATPRALKDRARVVAQLEDEGRNYLLWQARAVPGVVLKGVVLFDDDPAAAIIAHARREHVDLIAMATHGRTGLSDSLAGSVCEQVIRAGVAPVLAWRPSPIDA
jgi:nucleotide-binding universal stress UspA family protein